MYEYYNYDSRNDQASSLAEEEKKKREKAEKKALKKARSKKVWGIIGGGAAFGIIAAAVFAGVLFAGNKYFGDKLGGIFAPAQAALNEASVKEEHKPEIAPVDPVTKSEPINTPTPAPSQMNISDSIISGVSDVAEAAMPSIVAITNKSVQEVRMIFSFQTQLYESESQGSGIIVGENDDELLILTNNHVIDRAETLTVCFIDEEGYEATVKGKDASMDLAIIAVPLKDLKSSTKEAIRVAKLGDSDELKIGEQVVAIGNALGYGQSVTTGIVSALNRDLEMSDLESGLIQTDAAINPGNSGGALLNMKGEVIGVNSAKLSDTTVEGMCYAIPINSAIPIAEDLMNRQVREKVDEEDMGFMGIVGVLITKSDAEKYSMPEGIYLQQVEEGSPAEKAGLQVGDIVKKFDGVSISTYAELQDQMQYYSAGETIDLLIYRQDKGEYKEQTISITLGKRVEEK